MPAADSRLAGAARGGSLREFGEGLSGGCAAQTGKNSNTSQFFITLDKVPKLSGKHVIFGQVVAGENGAAAALHSAIAILDPP